jgi:hypothetical protein
MRRTRRCLEYFGHVSTNTMGSHVAYALAAGCRTSVWSPVFTYDPDVLAKSAHGLSRDYVDRISHVYNESYLRRHFPDLFDRAPTAGYLDPALGSELLGVRHRLTPAQVMQATGWTTGGQMSGYVAGAFRRTYRQLRSVFALGPHSGERRRG